MRAFPALILLLLMATAVPLQARAANDPLDPYAPQISSVASIQPGIETAIEGEVRTVWPSSFLLVDRTGQVVVDVAPETTESLGIIARGFLQVSGKLVNAHFIPMVLTLPNGRSRMFTGTDVYAPIDADLVQHNTRVWRIPLGSIAAMSDTLPDNNPTTDRSSSDVNTTMQQ